MSLLKSVLCKIAGLRVNENADACGDYFLRDRIDWAALGHPSHYQGKPLSAAQYRIRREHGAMPHHVPQIPHFDDEEPFYPEEKAVIRFNSPDNIQTPNPNYLRSVLPQEVHPFLAQGCKKDCRTWLWKNDAGRQARKQLGSLEKPALKEGALKPNSKFTFSRGRVLQQQQHQHCNIVSKTVNC